MCNNKKKCSCSCKDKIVETKLLNEVINLELTSMKKREALKYAKVAQDAILSIYELCQRSDVKNVEFLRDLDQAFANINSLLTTLVVQNGKDGNEGEVVDNFKSDN